MDPGRQIIILDLRNNSFYGEIPETWLIYNDLLVLHLQGNNLNEAIDKSGSATVQLGIEQVFEEKGLICKKIEPRFGAAVEGRSEIIMEVGQDFAGFQYVMPVKQIRR